MRDEYGGKYIALLRGEPAAGYPERRALSGYRGHVVAGVLWYGLFAALAASVLPRLFGVPGALFAATGWDLPVQILVAVLAALWPDVDSASQGRKLYYRVLLAFSLYCVFRAQWKIAAFVGLAAILPGIGNHRGWTHSVWAAFVVPLPILFLPLYVGAGGLWLNAPDFDKLPVGLPYYFAAVTGFLSHLAADGRLGGVLARLAGSKMNGNEPR